MGVKGIKRDALTFGSVLAFSLLLFYVVQHFEHHIYRVLHIDAFLTWHIALEFMSIIMSFCIFFVAFYTYEKSNRFRTLLIACVFLAVGLLDTFHTLSYQGMPDFLTPSSVPKATTFWIFARITMSGGLLAASMIPSLKTVRYHRMVFLSITLLFSGCILYLVTYQLRWIPALFVEGVGLTPLKIYLEYLIMGLQIAAMVFFTKTYIQAEDERGYSYIVFALLISVFSEMAFTLYSSVYDTYNLLGHIYKIAAHYLLFKALFVLNVQIPYLKLHEAEKKLSVYAEDLEKLVEQRTTEIAVANEKINRDLDYARNIQSALLPSSFPKTPLLDFAAKYFPCEKIGGDFYNVFRLDDENIGILIGDVAGHGVSAAMITVFIHQNIYVRREYDDGRVKILSPKQVMTNLYHVYNKMTFPEEVYTVMFYGIYHLESQCFTYCSAGMNTSPLLLKKTGEIQAIEIEGLPICKLGPHINPNYENKTIPLEEGDSLIFYTDGLIEIDRRRPDQFNEHNLMEFLRGLKDASAGDIADQLTDAFDAILGNRHRIDDVTILVAKINSKGV